MHFNFLSVLKFERDRHRILLFWLDQEIWLHCHFGTKQAHICCKLPSQTWLSIQGIHSFNIWREHIEQRAKKIIKLDNLIFDKNCKNSCINKPQDNSDQRIECLKIPTHSIYHYLGRRLVRHYFPSMHPSYCWQHKTYYLEQILNQFVPYQLHTLCTPTWCNLWGKELKLGLHLCIPIVKSFWAAAKKLETPVLSNGTGSMMDTRSNWMRATLFSNVVPL